MSALSPEVLAGLHDLEKRALTGDRDAVVHLVSLERRLRAAAEALLDSYDTGYAGVVFKSEFVDACEESASDSRT